MLQHLQKIKASRFITFSPLSVKTIELLTYKQTSYKNKNDTVWVWYDTIRYPFLRWVVIAVNVFHCFHIAWNDVNEQSLDINCVETSCSHSKQSKQDAASRRFISFRKTCSSTMCNEEIKKHKFTVTAGTTHRCSWSPCDRDWSWSTCGCPAGGILLSFSPEKSGYIYTSSAL